MKEKPWLKKNISPLLLLITGIIIIVEFIFQKNLIIKTAQLVFFMFLSFKAGNKIRIVNSLLIIFFITFFNLLTPAGEVLINIIVFPVTKAALVSGLLKGLTFTGLFYISKSFISRNLNFPGTFGRLINRTFFYLDSLTGEEMPDIKKPVKSLDKLMMKVYFSSANENTTEMAVTNSRGYFLIISLIILNFGLLLI